MNRKLFVTALLAISFLACEDYEGQIEDLNSNLKEIENQEISSIKSQMSEMQNTITHLQNTNIELLQYINTLQSQREKLEQTDKELSAEIEKLKDDLSEDINTSEANVLAQLESLRSTVASQLASLNASIDTLKAKDDDLNKQIEDLKKYIDEQSQNNRDWVTATFATLDQYNATATIVATIQGQIEAINTRIDSIHVAAGVSADDVNASISGLREELQPQIKKVADDATAALASVKKEIEDAYKTEIASAISSSETSLKNWINTQLTGYYTITQVDTKLSTLKTDLESQLEAQKTYLSNLISNLETSLNKKIADNTTLINALKERAEGFDTDIAELLLRITTNASLIQANAGNIGKNSLRIDTCRAFIDSCNVYIAANKKLIKENESAIEANQTAISALRERMTTAESNISANNTAILNNATAIAKNAQDIAANASLISQNATAISNNAQAISDNAAAIQQLRTDLATAKTEITAAYKKAIADAIETLDGKLSGRIAAEVDTINTRIDNEVATINQTIDALTTRVDKCEKDIKNIKNTIYSIQQDIESIHEQITAILARVQSITYVPKYSDGKAVMTYTDNGKITPGTATFDFELKPAATAQELAEVWQSALSMKAVYTVTKAAPETVNLSIENVTADNGFLTVTISGIGLKDAFFKSQCSANVRLSISDGNNDITTEYIQMVPWTTDVISFADANFKTYCLNHYDTNSDGEISEDEAKVVTAIDCSLANLTSLVGIEYFSNLTSIDVSCNKLTSLDLSHSPKLTEVLVNNNSLQTLNLDGLAALVTLDCSTNKLSSIDVSSSSLLQELNCNGNKIGSLNLKNNKALRELQCNNNNIAALDLKNNSAIETLNCRKNELNALNINNLTKLENLDCSANNLASVNIYYNTLLEYLYCASNDISSLGLTANAKLLYLDCSDNSLTSLDVTKNTLLETLNCSNNTLGNLDISHNLALEEINCTSNTQMVKLWVKDADQRDAMTIKKDNVTVISFNNGGINIPDANLKNYLLALFDDDEDGTISILESENIVNVNCSGRSISDLTGLESCANLKYLNFNNNSVTTVNLPGLYKLETIVAYGNPISTLNVNNDTSLSALYLQDVGTNAISDTTITITGYDQANSLYLAFAGTKFDVLKLTMSTVLKTINVTENVQLISLDVHGNSLITSVDLSTLSALKTLNCYDCALTALDVDHNPDLTGMNCANNAISSLNVDNNTLLRNLQCNNNALTTLKVTNNLELTRLVVNNNNLSNINVRKNLKLNELNVSSNPEITALALGYNTALQRLAASNTGLTDIDLSANTALINLHLHDCTSLQILDLSSNLSLQFLDISGCTQMGNVDLSKNKYLINLNGHELVDLGLSVRWATCNVGASAPEKYGDHFAWGETETKNNYYWTYYKYGSDDRSMTKYCINANYGKNGFTDSKTILDMEDDVARELWNVGWRIPTFQEIQELVNSNNCSWTWTKQNGVNGYKVTSKITGFTDRSIFLPAAGLIQETYQVTFGSEGWYWANTINGTESSGSRAISFNSKSYSSSGIKSRCYGLSVRPVCN